MQPHPNPVSTVGRLQRPQRARPGRACGCAALQLGLMLAVAAQPLWGQLAPPSAPPDVPPLLAQHTAQWWMQAADRLEMTTVSNDGQNPIRYRVHKVDAKGDVVREVIETRQGSVARLIQRNGQPLTAAEDQAERDRLLTSLQSPAEFLHHHEREMVNRRHALDLVERVPAALLCRYVPGQPQLPGLPGPQIVIDFSPDPSFHPPDMMAEILTGVTGRFWIDARTQHLLRGEATITHPVNFGWGLLGRIAPGGKVTIQQTGLSDGRWVYSALSEQLSVRALLVKNVVVETQMTASDFTVLPALPDYRDAIRTLLAEKIPLR